MSNDGGLVEALEAHHPIGAWQQPCGNTALVCTCGIDLFGVDAAACQAAWRLHIQEAAALSQPAVRLEAEAAPGISCPSCDGEGSCTICGGGGRIMSLDLASQPAENAKGGEVEPVGQVRVAANGEWILKGWATNLPEGVHWLYTNPPATQPAGDEPVGLREEIERAAQWLHDEGGFGDAWTQHTWPEHPDDTGQRDGGFVKIVPSDVQAKFREVATRMLRVFPSALATPARTDDAGTGSDPAPVDPVAGGEALRGAVARFLADWDDGDRADAGLNPLMAGHISDFRAALKGPAA